MLYFFDLPGFLLLCSALSDSVVEALEKVVTERARSVVEIENSDTADTPIAAANMKETKGLIIEKRRFYKFKK